jgi:DNA-binding response OmpR family regulator
MALGSILIVDDEETFRESTSRLLQREGFECHCVTNPEEALESLRNDQFDVMVSDIRMPRNPDLRMVREAREADSQLPVILVTGYPSAETAIRGIDLAVDAYLTKPLDIDQLLLHIRKAVERSHGRRRLAAVVERLHSVVSDLEADESRPILPAGEADDAALATIRTLAACLSELLVVWAKPAREHGMNNLCEILDCPQQPAHRQAILDAIEVLEKTKDNFRSKQLAELRARLENSIGSAGSRRR